MAEDDELRDLRAQRQKVAEHLRWLDQLIVNCEVEAGVDAPSPLYGERLPGVSLEEDGMGDEPLPPVIHDPSLQAFEPAFDPKQTKSAIQKQQMGCVAIAVFIVAMAFFTFWVLPGFIYD